MFLIGPGYIGLEVIDRLLENDYKVTALVHREAAATDLEKRGVKPIMGKLEDAQTIEQQVEASDIVFHTATADHLPSVEAVLRGIDHRASSGKHTIYIHTSGSGVLADDSNSEYPSEVIYSDRTPDQIDALPDTAEHRLIDLAILRARERLGTKAKIFIMLPPIIYGVTKHRRLSIQIPTMTRFALKHKYAPLVGKGKAVWSTVHVSDLSFGYLTILQWLVKSPAEVALEHPYFFCESGEEIAWAEVATAIGEGLHVAGRLEDPTPREVPEDQYVDLFSEYTMPIIGTNSRSRAHRLREMGWEPKHFDLRKAFHAEELPLLLNEDNRGWKGYFAKVAAAGAS